MCDDEAVLEGARPASRVLVISDERSILLLHAQDSLGHRWWLAPGGGVDASVMVVSICGFDDPSAARLSIVCTNSFEIRRARGILNG
jgi:hypothetical protein